MSSLYIDSLAFDRDSKYDKETGRRETGCQNLEAVLLSASFKSWILVKAIVIPCSCQANSVLLFTLGIRTLPTLASSASDQPYQPPQIIFCFLILWACSGCHNKYHRLVSVKSRNLFFHSARSWKSKIRLPVWSSFWWGPCSWLADCCVQAVSSHNRERQTASSLVLILARALNPHSFRCPTLITSSEPNYSTNSHLQSASHWGLGLQHRNSA